MSMLLNRVKFTEKVDAAMASGDWKSVTDCVQASRKECILALRADLGPYVGQQMKNMCTLFQEFADLVAELSSSDKRADVWKNEFKFYHKSNGMTICSCNGHELPVGEDFSRQDMLVCTPKTREARASLFDAKVNKKFFIGEGPAGTGKTETCKDTMRMMGYDPLVISCSDEMDFEGTVKDMKVQLGTHKKTGVIFDEFNRVKQEHMKPIVEGLMSHGVGVMVTCNPGYAGRVPMDTIKTMPHNTVDFTLPAMDTIVKVMMSAQGMMEYNELGPALVSCFAAAKEQMSKQVHYDFGMRSLKATVWGCGFQLKQSGKWDNEKQVLADFLATATLAACVEEDRAKCCPLIAEKICKPTVESIDRTKQLAGMLYIRHSCAVLGKGHEKEMAAMKAAISEKHGVDWIELAYDMPEVNFGKMDGDKWVDGNFTKAIRDMSKSDKKQVICFYGDQKVPACEWFENMNTVSDDNRCFVLANGEKISTEKVYIVFCLNSSEGFSPASVSRMGWLTL